MNDVWIVKPNTDFDFDVPRARPSTLTAELQIESVTEGGEDDWIRLLVVTDIPELSGKVAEDFAQKVADALNAAGVSAHVELK